MSIKYLTGYPVLNETIYYFVDYSKTIEDIKASKDRELKVFIFVYIDLLRNFLLFFFLNRSE